MSYTNFLGKTHSEKIVLVEFDELENISKSYWIKHSPNLWKTTYSWFVEERTYVYGDGAWGWGSYGGTETALLPTPERPPVLKIGSMAVDLENYTLTTSIEDCENLIKSFFWDQPNQILYIHTPSAEIPSNFDLIGIGVTQGFSTKSGYYNDLYYEGRIKSIPNISNTRDIQYYGLISFDGGSITMENTDGFFDKITNRGQAIRTYFGGDDLAYEDYELVYSGYIEEIDIQPDTTTFGLRDQRKLLEKSVPINVLSTDDYPDLSDDGVYQPIAYGKIRKATAISLDQEAEPRLSDYRFLLADPEFVEISSVQAVYVDGVSVSFTSDLVNNIVTISGTDYTENSETVSVSFTTSINQPLDIIQDLIVNHTEISYTSEFFNLTDWEYYKTIITQPLSIHISDKKGIIEIIGEICASVLGIFIIQGDGKISFNQQDLTKEVVKNIRIDEFVDKVGLKYDQQNYASSIRVGYNRTQSNNKYEYYLESSREQELKLQYRLENRKEFLTLLSEKSDAINLSNTFLAYYGGFFPTFTFKTKTQNMDIRLEDNVGLETYSYTSGEYATIKVEIIGIDKNFNDNTITFTGRYIGEDPGQIEIGGLIRWRNTASYSSGDVVSSGGQLWRAIEPSVMEPPSISSTFWEEFGKLYWFDHINYFVGDLVVHNGILWRATTNNINSEPGTGGWQSAFNNISGTLSVGAVNSAGSITGSSLSTSGNLTAGSASITGSISGADVTATGDIETTTGDIVIGGAIIRYNSSTNSIEFIV